MRSTDFSLRALYDAVDAQRKERGMSWAQVLEDMHGGPTRRTGHRLSRSTVVGLRTHRVAEGDGVLQVLRWLNRAPESFLCDHDHSRASDAATKLPAVPPGKVLRFDTRKLHAALDEQRIAKKLSWKRVAAEVGVAASSLTHLSVGGRTAFPQVMRMLAWLARPAARFTRVADR